MIEPMMYIGLGFLAASLLWRVDVLDRDRFHLHDFLP